MSSLANSSLYSTFYLSPIVGPFNSKQFTYLSKNKHSPPHTQEFTGRTVFTWGHDLRMLMSRVKMTVKIKHNLHQVEQTAETPQPVP